MHVLLEPFSHPFMRTSLAAGLLVSMTCACIGVFVLHRRMALLGDAISHAILPGLVLAHMGGVPPWVGALGAGYAAAAGMTWTFTRRALREEAAIAIVSTGMLALGVGLMSAGRSFRDFAHMLFGNILSIAPSALPFLLGTAVAIMVPLFAFRKEIELTSMDPGYGDVIGLSVRRITALLLALLVPTIVMGIMATGVMLTSALLVTPAATASLWCRSVGHSMATAAVLAALATTAGLVTSFHVEVSSGACIIGYCITFFLCARAARSIFDRRRRSLRTMH